MVNATSVRAAELAGLWYPESEAACRRQFERFEAEATEESDRRRFGGIVPHAGWVFSGSIAYDVLREIAKNAGAVDTLLLYAGHLCSETQPTVMVEGDVWTPLGPIATDTALAQQIASAGDIRKESPIAHTQDNSAEVLFPLIKHHFPDAALVILGVPPSETAIDLATAVMNAAEENGRNVLPIGSTDLTHYGPNYLFTPHGTGSAALAWVREQNDPLFVEATCDGTPDDVIETGLAHRNACCPGAAAATMYSAQRIGATAGKQLRYATSADTRPDDSFVGYAGIVY